MLINCSSQPSVEYQLPPDSAEPGAVWNYENTPLSIRSAELFESRDNQVFIRVRLIGAYGLALEPGPSGWSLEPDLEIVDAISFLNLSRPEQRQKNLTGDILLRFKGEPDPKKQYTLHHLALGLSALIDFSLWPSKVPPMPEAVKNRLPRPILPAQPELIELYDAAWTFLFNKISSGNSKNGFVTRYLDEGFNDNIYQWDSCFMTAFAIYGGSDFPAMETLDNFYNHQDQNGYICRCYNENTGLATGELDINPPLFAWMEERYWRLTGDNSRIGRVLPILEKYWEWIQETLAARGNPGFVFNTNFGSGMDNSPREEDVRDGAWVDLTAQQALAARSLSRLAAAIGQTERSQKFLSRYQDLSMLINRDLWDEHEGLYFDRTPEGELHRRKTIASFWVLVSGIVPKDRASRMILEHLKNPAEFFRPHLFPTLSADDPDYSPNGHYWRGGVWAPTTFMTIQGLKEYDPQFAHEAALNHIVNMNEVFQRFNPKECPYPMPTLTERNIARNGDGIRQIWEAYSPENHYPSTRWDNQFLVRQKFVGWSGLGPIALLIEEVLGFEANGVEGVLRWTPWLTESHGIQRLRFGGRLVDVVAESRNDPGAPIKIKGRTNRPFVLVVRNPLTFAEKNRSFPAGDFTWIVEW